MRWYRARDYSNDLECEYTCLDLDLSVSVEHELVGFDSHRKYGTTLRDEAPVAGSYRVRWHYLGPNVDHGLSRRLRWWKERIWWVQGRA